MKASVFTKYGSPDVLSIREMDKSVPKENKALIQVYAAIVNRTDYHVVAGTPVIMRLVTGLLKLCITGTGQDFTGIVEAVGEKASLFIPATR